MMEGKFIRDAMDVRDIAGASPRKPKIRAVAYNSIDYSDVNVGKGVGITSKQESVFRGKPLPAVAKRCASAQVHGTSRQNPLRREDKCAEPKTKPETAKSSKVKPGMNGILASNYVSKAPRKVKGSCVNGGDAADEYFTEKSKKPKAKLKLKGSPSKGKANHSSKEQNLMAAKGDEADNNSIKLHGGNAPNTAENKPDPNEAAKDVPNSMKEEQGVSATNGETIKQEKAAEEAEIPLSEEGLSSPARNNADTTQECTSAQRLDLSAKKAANKAARYTLLGSFNNSSQAKMLERLVAASISSTRKDRHGTAHECQSQASDRKTNLLSAHSVNSLSSNPKAKERFVPYVGKSIVYKNLERRCGGVVTLTYYSPK